MSAVGSLLAGSLAFMAPLAPAAFGGLATEYVGALNIALEGLILVGAFSYAAAGSIAGPIVGFAAALLSSAIVAAGADLFSRKAKADPFVVGLGVNMLAPAAASILSQAVFGTKGVAVVAGLQSAMALPGLRYSDVASFAVAAAIIVAIAATPFGTRSRAAGMNRDSLAMAGVDYGRVRGAAYFVSGLACGATGAALAASVGAWVPNMSAGRGWIALVAVYLGGKRLGGTVAAVAMFSLLLSAAAAAQAVVELPAELLMSIPYFAAALVVIVGARRSARRTARRRVP